MGANNFFDKSILGAFENFSKTMEASNIAFLRECLGENVSEMIKRSFQPLKDSNMEAIRSMMSMNELEERLQLNFKNISIPSTNFGFNDLTSMIERTFKNLNVEELNALNIEDEDLHNITIEEQHEIEDDIINIINNTLDEKTLKDCKEKWHEKHPVIFAIILIILELILGQLLGSIINMTTKKDSNIYIDSTNKSSIIISIPENTSITVIDSSTNYYYKILYTDVDSKNDIEGYIYKGNIAVDK